MNRQNHGFTLIEMLTALAVTTILLAFLFSSLDLMSRAVRESERPVNGIAQARLALDRMNQDLASRPAGSDLPQLLQKNVMDNDVLGFFSGQRSSTGDRGLSAVVYRLADGTSELLRLSKGHSFLANPRVPFGQPDFPPIADLEPTTLARSIIRMEFSFVRKDGTVGASGTLNPNDYAAVIATVAAVDERTRNIIGAPTLAQLATSLPDSQDNQNTNANWREQLDAQSAPGFPHSSRLVVFQRSFPLQSPDISIDPEPVVGAIP